MKKKFINVLYVHFRFQNQAQLSNLLQSGVKRSSTPPPPPPRGSSGEENPLHIENENVKEDQILDVNR